MSGNPQRPATDAQVKLALRVIEEGLKHLVDMDVLGRDHLQQLLGNSEIFRSETMRMAAILAGSDSIFIPSVPFELTVPRNFKHGECLGKLRKARQDAFLDWNAHVNDQEMACPAEMVAGKRYSVMLLTATRKVSATECESFLRQHGAILAGAQGLALAWRFGNGKFLPGWITSPGEDAELRACMHYGMYDDGPGWRLDCCSCANSISEDSHVLMLREIGA